MAGPERRPLEQAEHKSAQPDGAEARPEPVDSRRAGRIVAFIHETERQADDDHSQRYVEKERCSPAHVLDEPTADHRTERRGNRAEPGPSSNRPPALSVVERRADDRETSRHQEPRADSLQGPGHYEHARRWRGA